MILSSLSNYRDHGLLIIRLGMGMMYIFIHGAPKFFGGPERWEKIGGAMKNIGIDFLPTFWGFMAGSTEFLGGILIVVGLFFRPACIFFIITMSVAVATHFARGDGFGGAAHAIENLAVFAGLLFIGAGRFSIDERKSVNTNI